MAERTWSHYQRAVFDFIRNEPGNAVVRAVPGSGKTTTIVEAAKLVPPGNKVAFFAFNNSIVKELKTKLPPTVKVMSLHGFGLSVIGRRRRVDVDEYKGLNLVKKVLGGWDGKRSGEEVMMDPFVTADNCEAVRETMSLAKGMLTRPDDIITILDDFDISSNNMSDEQIADAAFEVMRHSRAMTQVVDYDDMLWVPYVDKLPVPQFDYVFLDETQDMNAAQLYLVLEAVKAGGRVIAVGDPRQAIYGFRGADSGAMDNITQALDATILPLSVCYRCGTSIVAEARKIEPSIESMPGATEGIVRNIGIERVLAEVKGGDFIISRTNAPLVSLCFKLLAQGRPAYIQGRDVGRSLKSLIEKSKAESIEEFLIYLDEWYQRELNRLIEREKSTAALEDRKACMEALCEGRKFLSEVEAAIDAAFLDAKDSTKVRLSSTHRAKGLEADRVFVIYDTYKPDADIEESNLAYVAITRAKHELVYVRGKLR